MTSRDHDLISDFNQTIFALSLYHGNLRRCHIQGENVAISILQQLSEVEIETSRIFYIICANYLRAICAKFNARQLKIHHEVLKCAVCRIHRANRKRM